MAKAADKADPWSSAPNQEAALREAITKALPNGGPSSAGGQLAKALYAATEISAQSQKGAGNLHDAVAKDIKAIGEALQFPEWASFFSSPVISNADRLDTLNDLFNKISASEVTRRFFGRLVESKQTRHVKDMVSGYQEILRSQKGEIEASVVTAEPLSEEETARLREIIKEEFLGGRADGNVQLTKTVDPDLLAGLTLTVGSTYVDLSVKSQIEEITSEYGTILNASRENALQRKV